MTPEPLLFLINSEISQWLKDRPALRDCQVVIQHNEHVYLSYDSYLDCTQTKKESIAEIESQLMANMRQLKDLITANEREAILYAVNACRTLSIAEKQKITEGLRT